ncbi:MAG: low molecular weight phosphatase family protein [Ruminococcus sp.]|nr:low molecular weight phosphatase family protein [Ruminococcus sp.]
MQKDKRYVAFVCTGNTCRSPMAEGIFNKLAEEKGLNITAESFGIATVTGIPVSENSVTACKELGVDLSQNKSTSVEDVELEKYERLYCMSPSHARVLSECYFVPLGDIDILGVGDPYGGSLEVYRMCRDEIYNSVKEIIKSYEDRKDD